MWGFLGRFLSLLLSLFKKLFRKSPKATPILPTAFSKASTNNVPHEEWDHWEPMSGVTVEKEEEKKEDVPSNIDFFADMVPQFKQPTQIRIRSSEINPPIVKSRLTVDTSFAPNGDLQLGDIDDVGGWAEEELLADNEILAVKNEVLREKRLAEREKRKKEKERSSKLS